MRKMILYAGIFIAGFTAISLFSFCLVTRPPKIHISGIPKDYDLEAEEVKITAADNIDLAGWFIPAKNLESKPPAALKPPAIILLHGNGAEKADLLPIAKALNPNFATLLMDLRYFGASGGNYSTLGYRERDDLSRAVDYLASRDFEKIGAFGFSLGGAIAITGAANDLRVGAVATYASHSGLPAIGRDAYRALGPLKYPLVGLMVIWAKLFIADDILEQTSPTIAARKITVPALLIHSREDNQIPFAHALDLRAAFAENPKAEFYFFDHGLHGELPPDFDQRLGAFLKKSL